MYASCGRSLSKIGLEKCAKTSTWWAQRKGGKGTQRLLQCQARGRLLPSERSRARAVDNLASIDIDSPSFRVARAEKFFGFGWTTRGRNRAGFVRAALSDSTRGGTAGGAIQHVDSPAPGGRGRPHLAAARAEPVRRRVGGWGRRRGGFPGS